MLIFNIKQHESTDILRKISIHKKMSSHNISFRDHPHFFFGPKHKSTKINKDQHFGCFLFGNRSKTTKTNKNQQIPTKTIHRHLRAIQKKQTNHIYCSKSTKININQQKRSLGADVIPIQATGVSSMKNGALERVELHLTCSTNVTRCVLVHCYIARTMGTHPEPTKNNNK